MSLNLKRVERLAKLVRDIGLIIGVPVLIGIGLKLHDQQTTALRAQNDVLVTQNSLLKETSYDRALSIIESQKKLFDEDRTNYEQQICALQKLTEMKQQEITNLQVRFLNVDQKLQELQVGQSNIIQQLPPPTNLRVFRIQ